MEVVGTFVQPFQVTNSLKLYTGKAVKSSYILLQLYDECQPFQPGLKIHFDYMIEFFQLIWFLKLSWNFQSWAEL